MCARGVGWSGHHPVGWTISDVSISVVVGGESQYRPVSRGSSGLSRALRIILDVAKSLRMSVGAMLLRTGSQSAKTNINNRDDDGARGSVWKLLTDTKVEPIATLMTLRRSEWFRHGNRREETENIGTVAEMKMQGKRSSGRSRLRWKDIGTGEMKAWKMRGKLPTDRSMWKGR